jgi:UDP-GlcNAc:undecaprenyl-phosphate GlcNAc-1-phosphate transferase
VISITTLQVATRTGWRLRHVKRQGDPATTAAFSLRGILRSQWLPRVSYLALAVGLGIYAALTIIDTTGLSGDVRILLLVLLAVIVLVFAFMRVAPLSLFEKGALYVTATVLVYLDAVVLPETRWESVISWTAVSVAAIATAIRLRLFNDRRFELTSLDVIVLFMALVVPNLPGTLGLPHGGALAIAKLVVVFYAIEMLITRSDHRAVWLRIATASVLAGLILRSVTAL